MNKLVFEKSILFLVDGRFFTVIQMITNVKPLCRGFDIWLGFSLDFVYVRPFPGL